MRREIRSIPGAPPVLGPYSPGVVSSGTFLFVSGQGPLDPATGRMSDGPVAEQTRLTLENLKRVVEAAGGTLADVVSVRVYLAQLTEKTFREMNEVYAGYFGEAPPARTTIGCQLLNMGVEIDCVVRLPDEA